MTKIIKTSSILLVLGLLLASCLLGCQSASNKVGVDERVVSGFKTKTYFNDSGNVEVTVATDGQTTIVAVPKAAISRQNQLSDDAVLCLSKCVPIKDLEKRLNCILLCPSKLQWQVFIS